LILRDALAVKLAPAIKILTLWFALVSRLFVPLCGFTIVWQCSLASLIAASKADLGIGKILVSSLSPPIRRESKIFWNAFT
jgi:hypothetical protein